MSFSYPYTCPDIDDNIKSIKGALLDLLEEYADGDEYPEHRLKKAVDYFYRHELEDIFEGVRQTNVDMRKEAESQMGCLQSTIDELELTIAELRSEITQLESIMD